jgi:hypothetical protein
MENGKTIEKYTKSKTGSLKSSIKWTNLQPRKKVKEKRYKIFFY